MPIEDQEKLAGKLGDIITRLEALNKPGLNEIIQNLKRKKEIMDETVLTSELIPDFVTAIRQQVSALIREADRESAADKVRITKLAQDLNYFSIELSARQRLY